MLRPFLGSESEPEIGAMVNMSSSSSASHRWKPPHHGWHLRELSDTLVVLPSVLCAVCLQG